MAFGLERLSDRNIAIGCFAIASTLFIATIKFAKPSKINSLPPERLFPKKDDRK